MKIKNKFIYNITILSISIFLIEMLFKIVNNKNIFDLSSLRILASSVIISLIISYIELFIKDKLVPKINILVIFVISIYSMLQAGFNNFLGVYISLNVRSQAGAVLGYIFDFFKSFYWYYYLILAPFILLIVYYELINKKKIKLTIAKDSNKTINTFALISFLLVFGFFYHISLNLEVFQNKLQTIENKELFKDPTNPSIAIKEFGTTVYAFLDIKNVFINDPNKEEVINKPTYNQDENIVDDTKWLELIDQEDDLVLNNLNNYFINNTYTGENSYTGLFEDKNLIVIMMESVNDIFINEEMYPNFYKLLSEGYYFKNHYSPRNSCATGNNELSGMIGLYSIYNKCTANAYSSNLYPESIFNLFNDKGYKTTSMHNYTEKYYERREFHTNTGSRRYYDVDDLKLEYNTKDEEWSSDEDFMKEVVKILNKYSKDERFMTWLTTVTSHQPYGSSRYGDKYLYLFENKKYDNYHIKLKRYMSKLKVLDEGLGVLLEGLEKQGKLEDTVIVLYGDHYPYGLSNKILEKALPYSIDEKYENERVPFVIWSNDIEATTFKNYTSYVNILPTIANLFNLDTDSRYYAGTDLFSNKADNLVIYADGSWKNEYAFYDASNSKITYYTNKEYTIEEIISINEKVSNKIKYSNLAIQHDYFNYLYENLKK
ncbi:MAG: sulfatase-like hydrolase/transferase [Bacilli bacterium]|nr:sulfatase-like hydrolase/transferase [Bacilli bacterium]